MSTEDQSKQRAGSQDAFAQWLEATGQSHLLEGRNPEEVGDHFAVLFAQFSRTADGAAEISKQLPEGMGVGPVPDDSPPSVVGGIDADAELYLRSRYDEEDLCWWAPELDEEGRILDVTINAGKPGVDSVEEAIRKVAGLRSVKKAVIDFTIYSEGDEPERPILADALAPLSGWRQLEEIEIVLGDAPPEALLGLSRNNPLSDLRIATIKSQKGGATVTQAFRSAGQLRTINLQIQDLVDDDFRWLSGSAELASLSICSTQVTGTGLASLQCQNTLHTMNLEEAPVSNEGLRQIGHFSKLRELYFEGQDVTDASFLHVGDLSLLRRLTLGSLGDVTAEAFSSTMARLALVERLGIGDVQFDDAIIPAVTKMPKLREFSVLGDSRLTPSGVRELQSLRPDCQVSAYPVFNNPEE